MLVIILLELFSKEHEIEGKIKERLIAYVAYQFSPTQLKYTTIEKEAYTVYHAVQRFPPYL